MPILLNNTQGSGRAHATIYEDAAAFFDIEPEGSDQHRLYAPILSELHPGAECIVASPAHDGLWRFARWEFEHEKILPDKEGELHRVLFGRRVSAENLLKSVAAAHPDYREFFARNGDFKRPSVIRGSRERRGGEAG